MNKKNVLFLCGLLVLCFKLFSQDLIVMQPPGTTNLSYNPQNFVGAACRTTDGSFLQDIQLYNGTVKLLSTETTDLASISNRGFQFSLDPQTMVLNLKCMQLTNPVMSFSNTGVNCQMAMNIGTSPLTGSGAMSVNGKIMARGLILNPVSWADFVFDDNYQLRSLEQVEQYIQQNKHLPDVPAAQQVEQEGADLAETDAILLRKIEELTLYVIEQEKVLLRQQTLIEELEKHRKQNALETHK